jgi:hypothetical protein
MFSAIHIIFFQCHYFSYITMAFLHFIWISCDLYYFFVTAQISYSAAGYSDELVAILQVSF